MSADDVVARLQKAAETNDWCELRPEEAKTALTMMNCTCPAGTYNPGNVHEPYCALALARQYPTRRATAREIEGAAGDLLRSSNETEQNYHRARLGHLVLGWPEPQKKAPPEGGASAAT